VDIGRRFGEAIATLFIITVVSLPLAIWKLVDIVIWLYNNVKITVGA
jgi:hypothetical protein